MLSFRDILGTMVFYAGFIGLSALIVHVGTSYGWEKVDDRFRDMEPRMPRGHYYWILKSQREPEQLEYEDVIAYRPPPWKRVAYDYEFARVIGKPGDLVEMRQGRIYRAMRQEGKLGKREPLTERYVDPTYARAEEFSEFIVPRNTLFVMFDDRSYREPLRNLLIPVRTVYGKVSF